MDNPFAYNVDQTSQYHTYAHAREADLSDTRETYTSSTPGQRRRPKYTRSKTGCLTCRKKKVKCDEVKPDCERCTNSGKPCTWPESSTPRRSSPRGHEQIFTYPAESARPYTAGSSAGFSDSSSTPSSLPESPQRLATRNGYEEDKLAFTLPLSRRHSMPNYEKVVRISRPMLSHSDMPIRLHHPHAGASLARAGALPLVHVPNSFFEPPASQQLVSAAYHQSTLQPPSALMASGLAGLSNIDDFPPYHDVRYVHGAPQTAFGTAPYSVHQTAGAGNPSLDVIKQEQHDGTLPSAYAAHDHPHASCPDSTALSSYRHERTQEIAAYSNSSSYGHPYGVLQYPRVPSPEPSWPTEAGYAYLAQPFSIEQFDAPYTPTTDQSAYPSSQPILYQPQPMQPASLLQHQ